MARLLIMLSILEKLGKTAALDRLAYYEFFSSHPYFVIKQTDPDWLELVSQGVELATIGYSSGSHRLTTRRQRLRERLAALYARALVVIENRDGRLFVRIADTGKLVAHNVRSIYADAFRCSARLVLKRLSKLSDAALEKNARQWLNEQVYEIEG